MTVIIQAPGGDLQSLARICVENEIGKRSYDSGLKDQAIAAVADYQPAYVRMSDYSDQISTNVAIWAMGGKLGVASLDPVVELRGLRQVANHLRQLWPEDFERRLYVALRNLKPINAMALLDRELLLEERGIKAADVDWSDEAAKERAAKRLKAAMESPAPAPLKEDV